MKSYLSLIPISARTRRKQNKLTLLCIVLAVFLVTSVFSMAEIMTKGEEKSMIRKHGNYHIIVGNLSEETAGQMTDQPEISVMAEYCAFGEDIYEGYQIADRRVILYGTEQAYISDIRKYEIEGRYPQSDREVMLNTAAKEYLGIHAGEDVTVHTPAGDFTYTVTGFCADEMVLYHDKYDGVCAYMNTDALEHICAVNGYAENGEAVRPVYYIRFQEDVKLRKAIADLKAQYHLASGDVTENMITVGMSGAASGQEINGLYRTAAGIFVMILFAGVLMISSCMNSIVSQRTKFFGMLRCIGASKKQVMRFVRLEGLNWCKTAIPAGLLLGILFSYVLCAFLKNVVGGEFSDFSFRLSAMGIVCGILIGVLSVLLAARAPAKRAAQVES